MTHSQSSILYLSITRVEITGEMAIRSDIPILLCIKSKDRKFPRNGGPNKTFLVNDVDVKWSPWIDVEVIDQSSVRNYRLLVMKQTRLLLAPAWYHLRKSAVVCSFSAVNSSILCHIMCMTSIFNKRYVLFFIEPSYQKIHELISIIINMLVVFHCWFFCKSWTYSCWKVGYQGTIYF